MITINYLTFYFLEFNFQKKSNNGQCNLHMIIFSAKPKFDLSRFRNMNVRAGQPVKLDIPYSGHPKPTFKLLKDGVPLENSDRVKIVDEDGVLKLEIPQSERGDSGEIDLVMENEIGLQEAKMNLNVQDKPEPPENLKVCIKCIVKNLRLKFDS